MGARVVGDAYIVRCGGLLESVPLCDNVHFRSAGRDVLVRLLKDAKEITIKKRYDEKEI